MKTTPPVQGCYKPLQIATLYLIHHICSAIDRYDPLRIATIRYGSPLARVGLFS